MHPKFQRADELSHTVIGAAIEVHRHLGPGLIESIYERCLQHELQLLGLRIEQQKVVHIRYKGLEFEEVLRLDQLVEDCLLLENKAVEAITLRHKAIALSYMKLTDAPVGLIINYHETILKDGITRLLLPGSNRS
jgi:GxxExxY protein